jgi:hypothetical protein
LWARGRKRTRQPQPRCPALRCAGDAQLRQSRWDKVAAALLQQRHAFDAEATLGALALAPAERAYTSARLHHKDLGSQADELLLKHLLLRAEDLPTDRLLQVGRPQLQARPAAAQLLGLQAEPALSPPALRVAGGGC